MAALPLFPVSVVGSWPRSRELLRAQRLKRTGQLSEAGFAQIADKAVLEALHLQEEAGVDVVTDGEQRRDNFYSFVADKLDGVRLMTLAEMLDIVEDKAAFERILQTLDAPSYAISNPTCVGRVKRRRPLALEELRFLKEHTQRPVKVTLPGPYLLTRAMYVPSVSSNTYSTKEDLAADVVGILQQEARELAQAGADLIQFDEPVLTELVFTQGETRTFMCAALAARKDPKEELAFAVSLINQVTQGLSGARTGLHVCRGNWSQNEATLLRGSYHPLVSYLEAMHVDQLVLEYATERAGDVLPFAGKELGLGVVNPRTPQVESVNDIIEAVERALTFYAPKTLWLNPDCGFGTFSARPMNTPQTAFQKLQAMAGAARELRATHPAT